MSNLIEVKNFSFSYNGINILQDITFHIIKGDYCSIIGPNGAGKTTLIRCLNRILLSEKGTILVQNKNIKSYTQKNLAKLISYVPQEHKVTIPFSVIEFISLGRYPYQSFFNPLTEEDRYAIDFALKITNTTYLANRSVSSLSGGERQKVFIAAAIAQRTPIMLLDEPTTYLDPKHQAEINLCLKTLNIQLGTTIISITHDINRAILTSNSIIALKNGSTVFVGGSEDAVDTKLLEQIFSTPFEVIINPNTSKSIIFPAEIY